MSEKEQSPASTQVPELVCHLFNGQFVALSNGNDPTIRAFLPDDDIPMVEIYEQLKIDYKSPLGLRETYIDVSVTNVNKENVRIYE